MSVANNDYSALSADCGARGCMHVDDRGELALALRRPIVELESASLATSDFGKDVRTRGSRKERKRGLNEKVHLEQKVRRSRMRRVMHLTYQSRMGWSIMLHSLKCHCGALWYVQTTGQCLSIHRQGTITHQQSARPMS